MDRISGLSDELLVKILLFVPTKVVVYTSLLSKRLEYLWMWLHNLDFCDSYYPKNQCEKLRRFLDINMPLHRAPIIESLGLELGFGSYFKPANIKLWILVAVSHRVRELEILYSSSPKRPNMLPSNLFTSNSLVVLKVVGDILIEYIYITVPLPPPILLDVPRMVSLPCLKTLHLKNMIFSNKESLQRLLSNCTILEDLLVKLCPGAITEKLTIVVLSLKSLSVYIPYNHTIDVIVIETPSLEYLKLMDLNTIDHYYLVKNMPNLTEAYIDVDSTNIDSLIRSITSVTQLAICLECHEPIIRIPYWNRPSTVPKCIMSSLQTFELLGYSGEPDERDLIVYILKNASGLKTATIKYCESNVPKYEMLKALALPRRASRKCKLMFLE
ncbi:unnamed protein product [Cochlearia groenlandica]